MASGRQSEETLCCCEYVNNNGERSHIAACCCDCEDVDEACDRCLKCEPQRSGWHGQLVAVVTERLRIPWLYGARRVEVCVLPPVLLPVLLRVAALHVLLGVVVMVALPSLVLTLYYVTHTRKRRSRFFLSVTLSSLAYMYYVFVVEVLPRGDVGTGQLACVSLGVALTLLSLTRTKRGPGFVQPHSDRSNITYHTHLPHGQGAAPCPLSAHRGLSEQQKAEPKDKECLKRNWCAVCRLGCPPRAGHCKICNVCVYRLDHHCVWIDSCVGQANHRSFLMTLLLFLMTSVYGVSLVLHTVCPRQNLMFALLYCPGVYSQYSSALCFTCAWYSSVVTGALFHLLLLQLSNVSYNVTEREARQAVRDRRGRARLCGLLVNISIYNRGFCNNWLEFLTMDTSKPTALTHLV